MGIKTNLFVNQIVKIKGKENMMVLKKIGRKYAYLTYSNRPYVKVKIEISEVVPFYEKG